MRKVLIGFSASVLALLSGCMPQASAAAGAEGTGMGPQTIIMYVGVMVVFFGAMYFIAIRPQKKQEKEQKAMLASMAVGDLVLTSSGFYGKIIDITDDTVIIEFGNNKNCRIPMQKSAVIQIEHPEDETKTVEKKDKESK